jgi:amino acid transporter
MGINIMVGAGVLAGPAIMAAVAGSASFLGWLLAAVILLPIVYSVARLPEVMPGTGGIYLYCRQGLGRFGGFAGGWLYFLCYNFSMTAILSAFRSSFLAFFPDMFVLQSKFVFLLICLAIIYALNLLSATTSARIQSYFTYFKLIPIITPILLLPVFFSPSSIAFSWPELASVYQTLPFAIFGFFGFEYCCNLSHMVKGGPNVAKKSILTGFLATAAIYTLFHLSVLSIMGVDGLMQFQASGYGAFVGVKFPLVATLLAYILPIATLVTFMNSSYGVLFLEGILLNVLAEDGLLKFSAPFKELNSNGRPWICVLVSALFSLFIGTVIQSTGDLAIACNLAIFSLLVVVIFALLKTERAKPFDLNRLVGIAAIIIGICLVVFNWTQIPGSSVEKFKIVLPLIMAMICGLLLFNSTVALPKANPITER